MKASLRAKPYRWCLRTFTNQVALFDTLPTHSQMIKAYIKFDKKAADYLSSSPPRTLVIGVIEPKFHYVIETNKGIQLSRLFVNFGVFR